VIIPDAAHPPPLPAVFCRSILPALFHLAGQAPAQLCSCRRPATRPCGLADRDPHDMDALPITSVGRFSPLGPLGMLLALALGQEFDWGLVSLRTILACGNPEFPAFVALDPDAVLVYPAVLCFADAMCHDEYTPPAFDATPCQQRENSK
jgi:hypothetical protein